MLLGYQKKNFERLKEKLKHHNHIAIIGKPKSGRKKVVSLLSQKNNIIINLSPAEERYTMYYDIVNSVKNIKYFEKTRKVLNIDLSIPSSLVGVSFQSNNIDLFTIKKEIIKRIKYLSYYKNIVFVVEKPHEIDDGSMEILQHVLSIKHKYGLKRKIIRIDICCNEKESTGDILYFDSSLNRSEFKEALRSLNLNPEIDLSESILDFIYQNTNSNIELLSKIVDDINRNNIDVNFNLFDNNSLVKELVDSSIESSGYKSELTEILTIISICDRYFNDVELSFLLEKESNIVELFLNYATEHLLLKQNDSCYYIIFGIIKRIFSTCTQEKQRDIYNKIIELIAIYYPDNYKEKAKFAYIAKHKDYKIYLLQYYMKMIRDTGKYPVEEELTDFEKSIIDDYYFAYCKSCNNFHMDSIAILKNAILQYNLTPPLKQEFELLIGQSLIKSIDSGDRLEAINLLSYDETDSEIDEYLKYRIETRKIAAYIHNGDYSNAKRQCQNATNRLLKNIESTRSPGCEYYLNIIYRKYCNINPYESSLAAIKKSVSFFSKNDNYIKALYIALNNEFSLELINGKTKEANITFETINKLIEKHFNFRFPRSEIFENNSLILSIINNNLFVDESIVSRFKILCQNTESADKILISSNLAIVLALYGDFEKAIDILLKEFNKLEITKDFEGIYQYRIICNLAILMFIQNNSNRDNSLKLLEKISLAVEEPHYQERIKEYNMIVENIKNTPACNSVQEWIMLYQKSLDTAKNYFCLYEYGLIFTTLFDWDDE